MELPQQKFICFNCRDIKLITEKADCKKPTCKVCYRQPRYQKQKTRIAAYRKRMSAKMIQLGRS